MMVQILLSTYNGEKYLRPLLDSVLAQDYPGIEFLVRDDGSCDGTVAILQEYADAHPTMTIVPGERGTSIGLIWVNDSVDPCSYSSLRTAQVRAPFPRSFLPRASV